MKVKRSSWHFKAWQWMQITTATEPPTICGYWSTIFISLPLCCILVVMLYPFAWLGDKLDRQFKGKSVCPFGRINIE